MNWDSVRRDERGQTSVEYALVMSMVAIVIVFLLLSGLPNGLFDTFWSTVSSMLD